MTPPPARPVDNHELRQHVRDFAHTHLAPRVVTMEQDRAVECELPRLIAEQGWIGVTIPRQYGGMGAGHEAKTVIIEEISRVSPAMGAAVQASQLGAAKIIHFGTEQQKRLWLPQIAAGTCLPTIAVTEPGCGGHVLGIQATASRDRGGWLLTGRKVFVGNSHIGHVHGVVARTGEGSRGLSAFLVETDRPGFSLVPHRPAMGLHGFSFGELVMDHCLVPDENLIGEVGDGLAVAYSSSILYGRAHLTALALGIHQAIHDITADFVRARPRYHATLADLPTVRAKLGGMHSRLLTARTTAYDAVRLLDTGLACDEQLMNAKHVNVELLKDSARAAMDIWAGAGLLTDNPIERYFRDAWHTYPAAGTGDIQLHRLGEIALGVQRPQWSQRFPGTSPAAASRPVPI